LHVIVYGAKQSVLSCRSPSNEPRTLECGWDAVEIVVIEGLALLVLRA